MKLKRILQIDVLVFSDTVFVILLIKSKKHQNKKTILTF